MGSSGLHSRIQLLLLIAERESRKTLLFTVAKEEKFDGKVVKFELRSIGEADDCAVYREQEAFTTAIVGTM